MNQEEIKIKHMIIHELVKEQRQTTAKTVLSKSALVAEEKSIFLIQKLNEHFYLQRTLITYGVFDSDPKRDFPKEFTKYFANQAENLFVSMTKDLLDSLRIQIQSNAPAKGGYFIFADYSFKGNEYFAIYLIRNTSGLLFSWSAGDFEINSSIHVDLENIAMAYRINKKRFQDNEGQYLGFMKKSQPDVSKYFINWISAVDLVDNKIHTNTLNEIIKIITLPNNTEGEEISRPELKKLFYDAVKSSPDKSINLPNLSIKLYGKENFISNFAEENNKSINSEFKPDMRILRNPDRIEIREDDINLDFSRKSLNTKIRLDPDNLDIVIIESRSVADRVREER